MVMTATIGNNINVRLERPVRQFTPGKSIGVRLSERGPQGRAGVDGAVDDVVYAQLSPLAEWVINHNLGRRPLVAVTTTGGVEVEANIIHQSENQARVYFEQPFSGYARLI